MALRLYIFHLNTFKYSHSLYSTVISPVLGVVRALHRYGTKQNRIRRARVGDTAQLGNARVDIPITLPGRWKRAARSCRPPRTNSPNQRNQK